MNYKGIALMTTILSNEQQLTPGTMTLFGNAQVSAIPDMAIIRLGAQTNGFNLREIQSENATISQAILQSLAQLGVTEIKTSQYIIDKNYTYENGTRVDQGYTVRNIFEIQTEDLGNVGNIIDTVVENGSNIVDFVSFEVSDPDYYYQQALNQALGNAIQKSISISHYLRLEADPLLVRIVESSLPQPRFSQFNTFREGVTTPIEPGRYMIQASVTVDFCFTNN